MKKLLCVLLTLTLIFAFTVCAVPGAAAASAPEDGMKGRKDGNLYVNEYFDMQAQFPASWRIFSDEETARALGIGADALDSEEIDRIIEQYGNYVTLYASKLDGSGDNVNIQIQKLSAIEAAAVNEDSITSAGMERLKKTSLGDNIRIDSIEKSSRVFAGKEHPCLNVTMSVQGVSLYEQILILKAGSYLATVTATSLTSGNPEAALDFFTAVGASADGADAKAPSADTKAAQDVLGEKSGNSYLSRAFGIRAQFPETWEILSEEDAAKYMDMGLELLDDETLVSMLEQNRPISDLFAAHFEDGDNINIQLQRLNALQGQVMTEEKLAAASAEQLQAEMRGSGVSITSLEQVTRSFAGAEHPCLVLGLETQGVTMYESMVFIKSGDYLATITSFSMDTGRADANLDFFEAA